MRIIYLALARNEYDRKLASLSLRPFTTHSISDFIEDIERLEIEILRHPGLRPVGGAPEGYYRSSPSKIYSYILIYRIHDGSIVVVALSAPGRRPLYWTGRII